MVGWHHQLDGHEFDQALGVGDGQGSLESMQVAKSQTQLSQLVRTAQTDHAMPGSWNTNRASCEGESLRWTGGTVLKVKDPQPRWPGFRSHRELVICTCHPSDFPSAP